MWTVCRSRAVSGQYLELTSEAKCHVQQELRSWQQAFQFSCIESEGRVSARIHSRF